MMIYRKSFFSLDLFMKTWRNHPFKKVRYFRKIEDFYQYWPGCPKGPFPVEIRIWQSETPLLILLDLAHNSSPNITISFFLAVVWEEFRQEPVSECSIGKVNKPRQEVSHKKKCLLPDTATRLPNGPLQNLLPKENLAQNVFPNPNGKRTARDFDSDGKPSPVFVHNNMNYYWIIMTGKPFLHFLKTRGIQTF